MGRKRISISDILEQHGVREALDGLCLNAEDRDMVLNLLAWSPYCSNQREPVHEKIKKPTLLKFPKRLRRVGALIEQVNSSPFLNPSAILAVLENGGPLSSPDLEPLRTWRAERVCRAKAQLFTVLPRVLCEYAAYLDMLLTLSKRRNLPRMTHEQLIRLKLLEIVKTTTGTPHYEVVAALLSSALKAAGQHRIVVGYDLKSLYNRNPQLVVIARSSLESDRRDRIPNLEPPPGK